MIILYDVLVGISNSGDDVSYMYAAVCMCVCAGSSIWVYKCGRIKKFFTLRAFNKTNQMDSTAVFKCLGVYVCG